VAQSLKKGIVVVETRKDLSNRSEDASLIGFFGVADARPEGVAVQIVGEASAIAVVEACTGEMVAVFDVCRASEANLLVGIEGVLRILQDGNNGVGLGLGEACQIGGGEQTAYEEQIRR